MVQDFQENYGSGWVSIYRSIKNHWIFDNDKYFKWWVIMLFEVNHKDRKFTRYYNIYDIKRGQSCNSLRTWAELFKTTPKTVSKFFDMLEKDKMIYSEKIGKGKQALTLVTIANYIDYQNKSKQDLPQEVNTEETRSKQDLPTNNNANNYNNGNNVNKKEIDFDLFWEKYPNKVGKQKSKKTFLKLTDKEIENILSSIDNFVSYKPFKDYNHPNPLTYLNQKRWDDEIPLKNQGKEIKNPNNEKIITYTSNLDPSRKQMPESDFLKMQEIMKDGGYIYKIVG